MTSSGSGKRPSDGSSAGAGAGARGKGGGSRGGSGKAGAQGGGGKGAGGKGQANRQGGKPGGGKAAAAKGGGRPGRPAEPEDPIEALRKRLATVLGRLPETQRKVLELRMGLVDGHPHTLTDTAKTLGISMVDARDIETRAFSHIRDAIPIQHLQKFLDAAPKGKG